MSDKEAQIVGHVNSLLSKCGLDAVVKTVAECTSSCLVAIFEALFRVRLDAVLRHPQRKADLVHNCAVVIDTLATTVLETDLGYIRPEDVCDGNLVALGNLVDILKELALIRETTDRGESILLSLGGDSDTASADPKEGAAARTNGSNENAGPRSNHAAGRSRNHDAHHGLHDKGMGPSPMSPLRTAKRARTGSSSASSSGPSESSSHPNPASRTTTSSQRSSGPDSGLRAGDIAARFAAFLERKGEHYGQHDQKQQQARPSPGKRPRGERDPNADKNRDQVQKERNPRRGGAAESSGPNMPLGGALSLAMLRPGRRLTASDTVKVAEALHRELGRAKLQLKEQEVGARVRQRSEYEAVRRAVNNSATAQRQRDIRARAEYTAVLEESRAAHLTRASVEEKALREALAVQEKIARANFAEEARLAAAERARVAREKDLRRENIVNHHGRIMQVLQERARDARAEHRAALHARIDAMAALEREVEAGLAEKTRRTRGLVQDLVRDRPMAEEADRRIAHLAVQAMHDTEGFTEPAF